MYYVQFLLFKSNLIAFNRFNVSNSSHSPNSRRFTIIKARKDCSAVRTGGAGGALPKFDRSFNPMNLDQRSRLWPPYSFPGLKKSGKLIHPLGCGGEAGLQGTLQILIRLVRQGGNGNKVRYLCNKQTWPPYQYSAPQIFKPTYVSEESGGFSLYMLSFQSAR